MSDTVNPSITPKRIPAGVSGKTPAKAKAPAWDDAKRTEFLTTAENAVAVTIGGQAMVADKRQFSTGSLGYYASGKVIIGGVQYQVGLNLTAIGSKPDGQ